MTPQDHTRSQQKFRQNRSNGSRDIAIFVFSPRLGPENLNFWNTNRIIIYWGTIVLKIGIPPFWRSGNLNLKSKIWYFNWNIVKNALENFFRPFFDRPDLGSRTIFRKKKKISLIFWRNFVHKYFNEIAPQSL